MEQYMLFFDIDGTLLDEKEGIVPESTVRALHQAKKKRTFTVSLYRTLQVHLAKGYFGNWF